MGEIILTGVHDRFPKLKFRVGRGGGRLGPYYTERWTTATTATSTGPRSSSRSSRASTCARTGGSLHHRPYGVANRHAIGIDNIMWSTDYRTTLRLAALAQGRRGDMKDVPAAERRKIVFENAARLYGVRGRNSELSRGQPGTAPAARPSAPSPSRARQLGHHFELLGDLLPHHTRASMNARTSASEADAPRPQPTHARTPLAACGVGHADHRTSALRVRGSGAAAGGASAYACRGARVHGGAGCERQKSPSSSKWCPSCRATRRGRCGRTSCGRGSGLPAMSSAIPRPGPRTGAPRSRTRSSAVPRPGRPSSSPRRPCASAASRSRGAGSRSTT